jgi:hypothetical protein|tara:strand:+ start:138 stop:383 length:246 start_codon:yes stop_codon:yes gene_type:complete
MSLKVDALRAKYIAMRLEAIATLEIYSKNAVGIGEHPQVIDEMDKLIRTIADTNGYLEALDAVFVTTDDGQEIGKTGPING